jgi:hypothetical protein
MSTITRLAVGATAALALVAPIAATQVAPASASPVRTVAAADPIGGGAGGQASLSPLQSGVVTQPSTGARVAWSVVRPVQDLLDQGRAYGYTNLGTIGNASHLARSGDHTPWSAGKIRGRVYAKDTKVPAGFEQWLVRKMRSSYNTLWIDFVNINGHQYNNSGRLVASSSDYHLHISVRRGYENARVSLFRDFHRETGR